MQLVFGPPGKQLRVFVDDHGYVHGYDEDRELHPILFAAQLSMGTSWRIGQDASERTELVAHGLFRAVRNPIYSAMLVTVSGLTLLCCSWITASAFATLLIALELQVRAVEEPYLARVHGDAYARYAAIVGRFIPILGRTRLPMVGV